MADNNEPLEIYDDLNPYVRLYLDETDSNIYHLQVMFRGEAVSIAESTGLEVMTDDIDPEFADYYIRFTLKSGDGEGNDPITTVQLRNPAGDGKGRILVMGTKTIRKGLLRNWYGPKGDGKTIIRFEDAVSR